MKLDVFISQVLTDIDEGLKVASNATSRAYHVETAENNGVAFDIAVTTVKSSESRAEGQAKAGFIEVLGAEVGAEIANITEDNQVSRIQFSVYVPTQTKAEIELSRQRMAQAQSERKFEY